MTTPSNVLSDEQIELLRTLPRHDEEQRLLTEDEFKALQKLPRFEMGWITTGYRHSEGFVRGDIDKFDHTSGMNYRNRSYLADLLLDTIDHHTQQARADERRRIDELAAKVAETPAEPHRTDGSGFNVEYLDESVLLYPQCDDDSYAVAEFAQGATFTEALAATQSTQAEAGDGA